MKTDWNQILVDLTKYNIDWVLANLDKVNFGNRDFITKAILRLVLRKIQTALITKNYNLHLDELRESLMTFIK